MNYIMINYLYVFLW